VSGKRKKWWSTFEDVPLRILGAIVPPTYKLLFGWLERRHALRSQERFSAEIRLSLPFLFTEANGKIIPNIGVPFPPAFDYAFVTMCLDGFLLRFARGRGELDVYVAPVFASDDWHDLSLILSVIENAASISRGCFRDLSDLNQILRPHWQEIRHFLSPERFDAIKSLLANEVYIPEKNRTREWEAEINWRLYGNKK